MQLYRKLALVQDVSYSALKVSVACVQDNNTRRSKAEKRSATQTLRAQEDATSVLRYAVVPSNLEI